jgi:hypothetical protein
MIHSVAYCEKCNQHDVPTRDGVFVRHFYPDKWDLELDPREFQRRLKCPQSNQNVHSS